MPDRKAMLRLAFNSISRIEAYGDYVRIYSATRAYLLRQTMSAIEKRLDPSRFVRVHRSAIVRKDCIRGLKHVGSGAWAVVSADGRLTRIGRGYLSAVRQEFEFRDGIADSSTGYVANEGQYSSRCRTRHQWARDLLPAFYRERSRAVPYPFSGAAPK